VFLESIRCDCCIDETWCQEILSRGLIYNFMNGLELSSYISFLGSGLSCGLELAKGL
jgi:hypothetical protein